MKKRYIIAIILTIGILVLTNPFWLCKKLVDVKFNIDGQPQKISIDVSLGSSKHQEKKIDLEKASEAIFKINKKGSFKTLKMVINTDLQPKWGEGSFI